MKQQRMKMLLPQDKIFRLEQVMQILKTLSKPKWTLLISLLILGALEACVSTGTMIPEPPDAPLCANLGDHGYCRYTISNKSYTESGTVWADDLQKSVIMPAATWAKFKAWTENVCHQVNCSNGVGSWDVVVQDLDTHKEK